jgi:predicted small secreted protein
MGSLILAGPESGHPIQPRGFTMLKRTIAVALVSFSLIALAACNTVEGAGRDVSSAGKAVSNAAQEAK